MPFVANPRKAATDLVGNLLAELARPLSDGFVADDDAAASNSSTMRSPSRVGMWRGGVRSTMSVAAPFVWRCLSGSAITPFPHPAHRTQQADFPHCALGQDLTPSPTTGRVHAGSDVRARSARRGASVDTSRLGVACPYVWIAATGATAPLCSYRARDRLGMMSQH